MKRHFKSAKGFTLIELLIVIAIILILIAIALPNFLEAQIRAKVVRAQAEMRTIATAMEMYIQDFKVYPPDHEPDSGSQYRGLFQLTSPLTYLTELPEDPFSTSSGLLDPAVVEVGWELASTGNRKVIAHIMPTDYGVHAFALASQGPETGSNISFGSAGADNFIGNMEWPFLGRGLTCPSNQGWTNYSPTNGSKSAGDLVVVGGEHRSGRYCIDTWQLVAGYYPANAQ